MELLDLTCCLVDDDDDYERYFMKWRMEGIYVRAFELEHKQLELGQRIGGERVQRIGVELGQHIELGQQRRVGQCRSVNYKGFGGKENHKLVGQSEVN